MSDAIATALISGLCVAVPSVITIVMVNRKNNAVMEYRLDTLEKKMDKHNDVISRTFVLEEKMSVANHRISDLEREEK